MRVLDDLEKEGYQVWPLVVGATDASGCGSWATPVAQPANGTPEDFLRRKRESCPQVAEAIGRAILAANPE